MTKYIVVCLIYVHKSPLLRNHKIEVRLDRIHQTIKQFCCGKCGKDFKHKCTFASQLKDILVVWYNLFVSLSFLTVTMICVHCVCTTCVHRGYMYIVFTVSLLVVLDWIVEWRVLVITWESVVEGFFWYNWLFTWWTDQLLLSFSAWHCWLGYMTRTNRPRYDLCVEPYSTTAYVQHVYTVDICI